MAKDRTPFEAYRDAQRAHLRAREWEVSGEAFELGADEPEPVEAATEALIYATIMVAEEPVPDTVRQALAVARAAHEEADAASIASEDDPSAVDADQASWDAFCEALDALWLAVEPLAGTLEAG